MPPPWLHHIFDERVKPKITSKSGLVENKLTSPRQQAMNTPWNFVTDGIRIRLFTDNNNTPYLSSKEIGQFITSTWCRGLDQYIHMHLMLKHTSTHNIFKFHTPTNTIWFLYTLTNYLLVKNNRIWVVRYILITCHYKILCNFLYFK